MAERKKKAGRKRGDAGASEAGQDETKGTAAKSGDKARRRQERAAKKAQTGAGADNGGPSAGQNEIDARLARIEEAVASQAERSQELMSKLDEVLLEARKPARHAKGAAEHSEDE